MEFNEFLLILHIVGAGTWFGANVVQAVAPGVVAKSGNIALAGWYRTAKALGTRLYMPAGVTVLLTGIFMVLNSERFGFSDTFVTIGFVVIVISSVLGSRVFEPASEQAAVAAESGDETALAKAVGTIRRAGVIDILLLLLAFVVMVLKLGAS